LTRTVALLKMSSSAKSTATLFNELCFFKCALVPKRYLYNYTNIIIPDKQGSPLPLLRGSGGWDSKPKARGLGQLGKTRRDVVHFTTVGTSL
jgi:hypothetical protein